MYAGLVQTVDIPGKTSDGYIASLKNGYLYWVTNSHWDSVKRKTVDTRIAIGKRADESGKMFPNKNYEKIFGPIDPQVAEIQDILKLQEPGNFDSNMAYAPFAIMEASFEKVGGLNALKRSFPTLWQKMFAIALHAVVSEDSTAQSYTGWSFDNYSGIKKSLSSSEISKIYTEVAENPDAIKTFFALFRLNFHEAFPESSERVIAFDSTNQVTESDNQPMAKYGKSKTGEPLPIINTAMYVDQITGISLWYEHFDGNVLDKSQTPYTVEKALDLGYKKIFLMMDRGYYSKDSVNALQRMEIGFAMMMPEVADITNETIDQFRNELRNNSQYLIPEHNIFGCKTKIEINGISLFGYVFYDDDTAKNERDAINSQVAYYKEKASQKVRYTDKMAKYFKERGLIITKKNEKVKRGEMNFNIDIDNKRVQDVYDRAGFFMMLSNRELPPFEIIGIGRHRDVAEKAFRHFKSHFNLKRTYSHNNDTYTGKMFVAFLGLVMLQSFSWFCRPILRGKSSATTATLISELHRYKMLKKSDGKWMPAYALNRQQKDICDCFGLTQAALEEGIRGLHL